MMGEKAEKIEVIEVNILSDDDDVGKEKLTQTTNGIDHALNSTRLESITDDYPTSDDQLSGKDQSVENNVSEKDQIGIVDEHENWAWGFYQQVKSLCFPVSKKTERQQRIKKILVSINSIEAGLNQVPDDNRIRCSKQMIETILLGLAIFTVIGVFMVPVILYYTAPPIPATDDSAANFYKTCILHCSNYTQTTRLCKANAMESIIPGYFAANQEEAEKKLLKISNITLQCSNSIAAVSFFCKAGYFPCSNNTELFPTYTECMQLQNDTCSEQWRDLQSVSPTVTCCNGYNPESPCPDQFARFCGVCTPVCHEFSQYGKATTVALDVISAISMIMTCLFGLLVFVAAFFKRTTMFQFPNVLILYFTAVISIYGIFLVIPIFWSKDLLCSHDNLFIAVVESTPFCQIQGFFLNAALLTYTEFWLLYVFHLFVKLVDPLKTWIINKEEYARRIHILEVVTVFFFGLITPITAIATTDGYHITTFPPRACAPAAEVAFHGILLPYIIMCMVGICLILVTFFHIHRTTGIFKRTKKGIFILSIPEVKLLIISLYLTIVLGVTIIQFTLTLRDLNEIYGSIVNYSQCVASGNCDCGDTREIFEKASLPELAFVFYICFMFLNASNLLFIIQLKDVKQIARHATKSIISTDTS